MKYTKCNKYKKSKSDMSSQTDLRKVRGQSRANRDNTGHGKNRKARNSKP